MRNVTILLAVVAVVAIAVPARAVSGTWGVDTSGDWSDAGNWQGGTIADGAESVAYFTTSIVADRSVTLTEDRTIGYLEFSDGGSAGNWWNLLGSSRILTLSAVGGPSILAETYASIGCRLGGEQGFVNIG